MNKMELVSAMAEKSGLSKKNCEIALAALTEIVVDALKEEDKVQLVGFGSFGVKNRAARTGRNPRTNESVKVPATKLPIFKASKTLKNAIN